jgi:hypothetical protein
VTRGNIPSCPLYTCATLTRGIRLVHICTASSGRHNPMPALSGPYGQAGTGTPCTLSGAAAAAGSVIDGIRWMVGPTGRHAAGREVMHPGRQRSLHEAGRPPGGDDAPAKAGPAPATRARPCPAGYVDYVSKPYRTEVSVIVGPTRYPPVRYDSRY